MESKLMPCKCGGRPYKMREWKAFAPFCLCWVICPKCNRRALVIHWGRNTETIGSLDKVEAKWNARRSADDHK